jgi:hypothetical protein
MRHLISSYVIFCVKLHIILFMYNLIYFILKIILMDHLVLVLSSYKIMSLVTVLGVQLM